jgi:putative flippase GtrA
VGGLGWRVLRFNAVGAMGFAVQLGVLAALHGGLGLGYPAATALAVECAVLHNFLWHERWTWRDRERSGSGFRRLCRFNLTTGLVSLAVNVALMQWLAGWLRMPYLAANLLCVAAAAAANYAVSDCFVFTRCVSGPATPARNGA